MSGEEDIVIEPWGEREDDYVPEKKKPRPNATPARTPRKTPTKPSPQQNEIAVINT